MVRTLHRAGLEVLLDVVYNHTCEGDHEGPTVSLRGIDNAIYYRLKKGALDRYEDFTGCGNTLDMMHPQALKLVMDSLRYWVTEMHVDGFRFDLASALGRELGAMSRMATFFDIIYQDPVLSRVKLVAEPWDVGEGGYQVGNFPVQWTEWNGKYRDTVRRFWRGRSRANRRSRHFVSRARAISSRTTGGTPARASTSSPRMTASRCAISSRTKRSTTKETAKRIATARATTRARTRGVEGDTTDPTSLALRARQIGISSRRSSSRRACR